MPERYLKSVETNKLLKEAQNQYRRENAALRKVIITVYVLHFKTNETVRFKCKEK